MTFYLLYTAPRRLKENAVGTVQTWHEIYREHGYIPWVLKRRNLSDAGHVAHLIHMMSYILMDRAGTPVWQLIREQRPEEPISVSLPDSVLKAQGLK